jgi:sugar/nucleoside kinase (ribokinase family)
MRGVLCTGNLVTDLLVRPVDRMVWGAATLVESIEQHLGGNGSNTSYTLGKLDVPVRVLGMVGNDTFGDYVLAQLGAAGVDTSAVRRSAAPTAASVALVKSDGDRLFLHRSGASQEVDLAAADLAREFAADPAFFHLASPFGLPRLRPRYPEILQQAQAAGLSTSIDTHWDSTGRWLEGLAPSLPFTNILFVNEDEARMLAGTNVPEDAARTLRQCGARAVVMKLGRNGCAVFRDEGCFHTPAFDVPVVDTTGAGDCFVAGFLAALARGCSWEDAALYANAVGALSIQRLGGVEGVLTWDETARWIGDQRPAPLARSI